MADDLEQRLDANKTMKDVLNSQLDISEELEKSLARQLDIGQQIESVASKGKELAAQKKAIQTELSKLEKDQAAIGEQLLKYGYSNSAYEKELNDLAKAITAKKYELLNVTKAINKEEQFEQALSRLKLKGIYDGIKQLQETLSLHPQLAVLGGMLAVTTSMVVLFKHLDEAAANFRRSMGFTREFTQAVETNMRSAYFDLVQSGVEAKDLYEALQAGAATIGTFGSVTTAMAKDMALMSANLGVAAQTSAAFASSMAMAGKSTMDAQKDMLLFTAKLSEAAGTNLNEVMQDVASATKSSYQFMLKQPAALVRAAVEARRMGTSLDSAAKSASSLLNFSESVNAEMQASVLLGQSLNLQRLRELSYRKQLGAVNKEILDIAKQVHFDDLDPFQQEAVAKALGKSAEEVGKMLQADKEMGRIRSDGSLTKQVQEYDKLKDATGELVRLTAEGSRNQLRQLSNQESLKAISLALKSIYQSMFEAPIKFASEWLPKIAIGLNKLKEYTGAWGVTLVGIAGLIGLIMGPTLLGALAGFVKARIFGMFGKDVAAGAKVAGEGIKEGLIDKLARGMTGLEKIATGFGRIIVKLGVAVGRGIGSVLQFTLRGLALGLKALGNPQVLLGAVVLGVVGLAFMAFGKAAEFVARALKSLEGVNLVKMAGGLALVGLAMLPLALVTPVMLPLALGLLAFGAALRFVVGPAERMGQASMALGEGLKKAADGLTEISHLSILTVIKQFRDLSNIISELSKEFNNIPDIKIEKIQDIIVRAGEMNAETADKSNEKLLAALVDIKSAIGQLQQSLETGGIAANVQIDSQKLESATARTLAFKGTKSPQPSFI